MSFFPSDIWIWCFRTRPSRIEKFPRLARKRQCMQAWMQDFLPSLPKKLPGGRVSRWLYLWKCHNASAGDKLVQYHGRWLFQHTDSTAVQLWLAGELKCNSFLSCMSWKMFTLYYSVGIATVCNAARFNMCRVTVLNHSTWFNSLITLIDVIHLFLLLKYFIMQLFFIYRLHPLMF